MSCLAQSLKRLHSSDLEAKLMSEWKGLDEALGQRVVVLLLAG